MADKKQTNTEQIESKGDYLTEKILDAYRK